MHPKPIFVLGLQRSGTTWIGNLLAAHPQVAAAVDARHRGIHESVFFSHFAKAWDWSDPGQRQGAITAFLQSDYGRLLGLSAAETDQLRASDTPADMFRQAMGCLARRTGADAWVEKSPHHIQVATEMAEAMPDAVFVTIQRDSPSLVASRLFAYGRQDVSGWARFKSILRGTLSNTYHRKLLSRLVRVLPGRVIALDYSAFKAGGDTSIADLLTALQLRPCLGLAPQFAPNSSFSQKNTRAQALSRFERALISGLEILFGMVPLSFLDTARTLATSHNIVFPKWVWSTETSTTRSATAPTSELVPPCRD